MKIEKINELFARFAGQLLRRRWLVLATFVLVMIMSVIGMKRMVKETSFDDYFIEDDPMLVMTDEFKSHFGNDYYVGVLTQCDNHFTQENLATLRALSNELLDSLSYADKVTSLTDIEFMVGSDEGMTIEQIVPDEIPEDGTAAMDSIKARAYSKPHVARKLISQDGRLSWIMVKLRTFPKDSVWKQQGTVAPDIITGQEVERIIKKPAYASLHPKGTGMPYVTNCKTVYIGQEMSRLMMIATIVCMLVMLCMTRSLRGVLAPIISVVGGLFITYGIAGWTKMYVDSTVLMIPTILAFAVAIAYNIHIFSYFRGRMRIHGERRKAVVETLREIGWSVFFCGFTTLVSLLSFLVIPIRPMHCVGVISSMSVLFVLLTSLIISPVLLSFGKNKQPKKGFTDESDTRWTAAMVKLSDVVLRNPKKIGWSFLVVCLVLCVGLWKIEAAFDIERTMGEDVPYVKEVMDVGRSELGSLYSYDLIVELSHNDEAKEPDNLHRLDELQQQVGTYDLTKRTTSILDILKDLNQTLNDGDTAYYRVPDTEEEVAQEILLYENAGGTESEYWVDYDYRRLRLMVEISDFNSAQVEREMARIQQDAQELFPGAKITTVGNIPQYVTMMQYLVRGQMLSFVISILIIGIILMIAFQSIRVGLIGLIPNMMPAIFVGGYMGWMGVPLDMMTATLLPMMLGMAVDDTIHFINHSKLEFDRTHHYREAIRRTFRVVGVAIVITSIITSAVFAGFCTSACTMCINFGLMAVIGILSALAADLLVTPILVNKCKVFGKK
ncbi:MMPL family transporter [Prevotella sp. E15-22]|uniref:efflux RND transporter permease subunit n=1 Tax=Prevotella sp. E15-22 TaxID=2937774 RepID=UPI00205D1CAA|nr:MMPL family transporter [Prevotella sp. E15-22]UPS44710.1 MMPL family transporter [Prevotella sp. E15-22]